MGIRRQGFNLECRKSNSFSELGRKENTREMKIEKRFELEVHVQEGSCQKTCNFSVKCKAESSAGRILEE